MKLIIFLLSFSISSFAAVNKIPAAMLAGNIPMQKLTGSPAFFSVMMGSYGSSCTSSPCSLTLNKGGVVTTIVRNSQGDYTMNMTGISSAPNCSLTANQTAGANAPVVCGYISKSSSSYNFQCKQGGSVSDTAVEIRCESNYSN